MCCSRSHALQDEGKSQRAWFSAVQLLKSAWHQTGLPGWDFVDGQSGVGGSVSACSVLKRVSERLVLFASAKCAKGGRRF